MKRVIAMALALLIVAACSPAVSADEIPNDPHYDKQWNLEEINAQAIWENGITGEGVRIAIIDTGIFEDHEDINYDYIDAGYNYIRGSYIDGEYVSADDLIDYDTHGSNVAGIICAVRNNSIGIAGMLDKATIVPLIASGTGSYAGGANHVIAQAIRDAVDIFHCDVINMSLSSTLFHEIELKAIKEAVDYAVSKNVILVAGSGNGGLKTISFPVGFDGVIGVGAISPDGTVSSFSNHNESVFVSAPGRIVATLARGVSDDRAYDYALVSGTSISTPHVTALAGVAKAIDPDITVDEFKALLIATSDDRGAPGWDEYYGYGVIDCEAFINTMLSDDWTPDSVKVKRFRDVEGHWGKEGIGYVVERGLFGGTSEYTFEPNVSMSRAMFATVLGRLYEDLGGSVETSGSSAFTDVKADSWYDKYVLWASENGLVDGYDDGRFGPNDDISREQMVLVLYRLSELMDMDVSCDTAALDAFADTESVHEWAHTPVAWAVKNGLITGVKENGLSYLKPSDSASRAQTAAILQRYMELNSV